MEQHLTTQRGGAGFALGTAQLGLPYGVSNKRGKPSMSEAGAILSRAAEREVKLIDTAPSYGDCESRLGALLPDNHEFKIVTKYKKDDRSISREDIIGAFRASFDQSLGHLKQSMVHALLFHNPLDLLGRNGGDLFGAAQALKAEKRVGSVGVSVYSPAELTEITDRFPIDLAQVPMNVLDQRMLQNGHLEKMKRLGIQVHARSVLLQGLLLLPINELPAHFRPHRAVLQRFRAATKAAHLTPLAAALSFVKHTPGIDYAIVGICNFNQYEETNDVFDQVKQISLELSQMASDDLSLIDPTRWRIDR